MQKSKRGRALFDKLSENGGEISDFLRQDHRWGRGRGKATIQSTETSLRLVCERDRFDDGETWFCLDAGRLWLSITPKIGAVVVFVVVLAAVGSFLIGRSNGRSNGFRTGFTEGRASVEAEAQSEIEIARAAPPAEELVSDLLPSAPAHAENVVVETRTAVEPSWTRGHTYIVAQEFAKGRDDDARKAHAFLADHGVEAAVVKFPSGRIQLITVRGFDRDTAEGKKNADDLLAQVRAAGQKFFDSGGRYKLEGYFKKLTGNSW